MHNFTHYVIISKTWPPRARHDLYHIRRELIMNTNDKLNQTASAAEQATEATLTAFAEHLLSMPTDDKKAFGEWANELETINGPDGKSSHDLEDEVDDKLDKAFIAVRDDFMVGKISEEVAFYKLAHHYRTVSYSGCVEDYTKLRALRVFEERMHEENHDLAMQLQLCADYAFDNADNPDESRKALAAMSELLDKLARYTGKDATENYMKDGLSAFLSDALSYFAGI